MGFTTFLTGWPLVGAAAALYVAWVVVTWLRYPRAPGPWVAQFSNIWFAWRMKLGHFEKENVELHQKYGKIVRLGPDLYSLDDAAATKTIYGHGTQFVKADWYKIWQLPTKGLPANLFALQDVKQHSIVRRMYANVYAMSSLVGYEPYVDNCVDILLGKLSHAAKQGQKIDMAKWFQYYAFDVIGEITFSKRFGFMEEQQDIDGLMATIVKVLEFGSPVGLFPALVAFQDFLTRVRGPGNQGRIGAFAAECIAEAKKAMLHGYEDPDPEERKSAAPDFCSKLLAITDTWNEKNEAKRAANVPADLFVQGGCWGNVFAGSDTTSISLNGVLFHLITYPKTFARLRQELDEAAARGRLSDPPTFAETQDLPYLQAVIKEGLRMHPATGIPLWRTVPAGGATLCGTYFPAGTSVGINSWVAHRNRDVWGPDADEFRPERWLESPEEMLKEMNAMHMPFGLGSRTCIGKNISLLEMAKVIPQLVRRFDITYAGEGTELPARCDWFVKQKEFMVQMKPREA